MARIVIQHGSAGQSSSSGQNRSSTSVTVPNPSSSSTVPQQQVTSTVYVSPAVEDENFVEEVQEQNVVDDLSACCGILDSESKINTSDDISPGGLNNDQTVDGKRNFDDQKFDKDCDGFTGSGLSAEEIGRLTVAEEETDVMAESSFQMFSASSPPPPPIPPPKTSSMILNSRRVASGDSNTVRVGSSRRTAGWTGVSSRSSPSGSHPSSSRSNCDGDGYNSADEQSPCFSSSYDDAEREHQFQFDLRRVKGLEVRKMLEDGNCLFRAVADEVYGDSELYDLVRQMCIDYMERERDHFSQFLTEGFTSYCKRKRRDKVYGNNIEIQALSEMYNRPIHIYSYTTEPINIFHGSYNTDTPPIHLSYHHGNHYNSLVDPRRVTIGAGLGFNSLQGTNIDEDKVKAAIKAQQDQQIENALLAEGRFYSDLELTEKEIERMVMEASRAEYDANDKFKLQLVRRESSTSRAEPSSSTARSSRGGERQEGATEFGLPSSVLSNSTQIMLSMGFSYLQVIEASSIFGDDVDSMVCYLIETSGSSRWKGKATE